MLAIEVRSKTAAKMPSRARQFPPIQVLVGGFILITLIGAILLTLPVASSNGLSQPFVDALFTAASGISTTGLCVVDIGGSYSLFGQIVLLTIVQIGGLGYMVFIVLLAYILAARPSLYAGRIFRESTGWPSLAQVGVMVKSVLLYTLFFEGVGAAVLTFYWAQKFSLQRSIYLAIFHSISGFCTAGFGLFPDNMIPIRDSLLVNLVIDVICIAGAIGFFVLYDLHSLLNKTIKRQWPRRLSVHSKIVLIVSTALMAIGTGIILISEKSLSSLPWGHRLLASAFQSISASTTTGYNSTDIGAMGIPSLLTLIFLMFIGASPGGTGGGIKTTTFAIMLLSVLASLRGKEDINVFKRRISPEIVNRAFAIAFVSISLVMLDSLILTFTEKASLLQTPAPLLRIVFEIVSGFGNVGLSMGITPNLTIIGKLVITVTMFIGRVGPLAIGLSLLGTSKPSPFGYAQEQVYVG